MTNREVLTLTVGFFVVAFPAGMIGAFGLVRVIEWAIADTLHYGMACGVLGLLLGLVIGSARNAQRGDTR